MADNETATALTKTAFVVQLKVASVKPQDMTLNFNLQKSAKYYLYSPAKFPSASDIIMLKTCAAVSLPLKFLSYWLLKQYVYFLSEYLIIIEITANAVNFEILPLLNSLVIGLL